MSTGERAFTAGKIYEEHKWRDGVVFINDMGEPHIMPQHLLDEYFERQVGTVTEIIQDAYATVNRD